MGRGDLTNEQWARLAPLLPKGKKPGRPPTWSKRQLIDGIRWRTRTGAPWRDLPAHYGSWKTVASRFYRWRRDGVFERLLGEVHRRADACGELDWPCHYVDGSVVRAHQHAAGARHTAAGEDLKTGIIHPQDEALGQAAVVEHQAAPAHRRRRSAAGPAGQRHEVTQLERLLDGGAVKRTGTMDGPGGVGPAGAGQAGRGQWLLVPECTAAAAPSRPHPGDPRQVEPAPPAQLRPRCLPRPQPGGAQRRAAQAVPPQ
jgi:transposase